MRDVEAIEACDRDELENVVLARVSSELTPKEANASRDDGITCSTSAESAIAGAAVVFVEAAKRGFDVGDVEATLRRDGGVSSEKAKLVANAYGKMRRTLERELKKYASSTSVKRLKEHRCQADYVVSTSASGEKREPTFHVSWLLSDGASGEDERINFTCDTEEMLHLVETLREACKASETIAASSA